MANQLLWLRLNKLFQYCYKYIKNVMWYFKLNLNVFLPDVVHSPCCSWLTLRTLDKANMLVLNFRWSLCLWPLQEMNRAFNFLLLIQEMNLSILIWPQSIKFLSHFTTLEYVLCLSRDDAMSWLWRGASQNCQKWASIASHKNIWCT